MRGAPLQHRPGRGAIGENPRFPTRGGGYYRFGRFCAVLVRLLLAGCAMPTTIFLKHPQTGAIQQCHNIQAYLGEGPAEKCAKALARDGWVRLNP